MSGRSSIGILGSGTAALTLRAARVQHGHPVMLGSRRPSKLDTWRTAAGRLGLFVGTTDSLGERIQRLLPEARVVHREHSSRIQARWKVGSSVGVCERSS